jgi:hypothetical protein
MGGRQLTQTAYQILTVILAVIGLGVLYYVISGLIRLYLRFRGTRIVECPETHAPAAVQLDVLHAIMSSVGKTDLRLTECSRWPERQGCGRECLSQVEGGLENCLLRNLLSRWYADKSCALCGTSLANIDWLEHKPALLSPEQVTLEWVGVPPETIPALLKTYKPVCWNCHIASTFRRQHPELVVDRSWKKP